MLWIILGSVALLTVAFFGITYVCYRMAFYMPPRKEDPDAIDIPDGEIYEPYREKMEGWTRETRKLPREEFTVTSFDGLTLYARYYEFAPGAPIELMFHGYRGNGERDLSGGVQRCFKLGRSAFIVDQRCCGRSEGRTITFGVREHRDCLTWLEVMEKRFGKDAKIILTGISMGAATVVMAAGRKLPETVVGVLADCGYSTPADIIRTVIGQMGLPVAPAYFFVKLAARIFGGFDLESYTCMDALKSCKVPVIFYHGEDDAYVPCEMSRKMYEACPSRKKLVTVPGAGHGLSYPVAPELYLQTLREFFAEELK